MAANFDLLSQTANLLIIFADNRFSNSRVGTEWLDPLLPTVLINSIVAFGSAKFIAAY